MYERWFWACEVEFLSTCFMHDVICIFFIYLRTMTKVVETKTSSKKENKKFWLTEFFVSSNVQYNASHCLKQTSINKKQHFFQVTPNRLTVTEGHSAGHVTVTSTAPPQFYCCKGCKGVCQIHIVTSWTYDRHDLKCGKKVIAQVINSI